MQQKYKRCIIVNMYHLSQFIMIFKWNNEMKWNEITGNQYRKYNILIVKRVFIEWALVDYLWPLFDSIT